MGSFNIETMRSQLPGKSDAEAAKAFAKKHGYIAIVRYKNSSAASDFTNIGTCKMEEEVYGYLRSSSCAACELIYDGRATALRITEKTILAGKCQSCGKGTTKESLQRMGGNDFYICPRCAAMFCDRCYGWLPLTSSPGYGMCPTCRVQVQRAIIGFYGDQSGADWARRGKTFEEKDNEEAARFGPNVKMTRVFAWSDMVKDNELGTFSVCALEGEPHLIARLSVSDGNREAVKSSIEAGRVVLRISCYRYETYPVIYNRVFFILGAKPNGMTGTLIESATNFIEANFQAWAVTLLQTRSLNIHAYCETQEHLASGKAVIDPTIAGMVISSIDEADAILKTIPTERQDFKAGAQAFFRDHPQPFLFDAGKGSGAS
jgi:hypothetical protein